MSEILTLNKHDNGFTKQINTSYIYDEYANSLPFSFIKPKSISSVKVTFLNGTFFIILI
jgi:hypothetical protein